MKEKEKMKTRLLKNAERAIRKAAVEGGGFPTWLGFHEPEQPETLKKLIKEKMK